MTNQTLDLVASDGTIVCLDNKVQLHYNPTQLTLDFSHSSHGALRLRIGKIVPAPYCPRSSSAHDIADYMTSVVVLATICGKRTVLRRINIDRHRIIVNIVDPS